MYLYSEIFFFKEKHSKIYSLQTSATTDKQLPGALGFAGFVLKLDKHGAALDKNTT